MKAWFILSGLLLSQLVAADVWTLRTGPTAVSSIPLAPVQLVSAWRGSYSDGTSTIWVYLTQSPQFFAPPSPDVSSVEGMSWVSVFFFPEAWTAPERRTWRDLWWEDFRSLASLPNPGFPVVFPAVLKK